MKINVAKICNNCEHWTPKYNEFCRYSGFQKGDCSKFENITHYKFDCNCWLQRKSLKRKRGEHGRFV